MGRDNDDYKHHPLSVASASVVRSRNANLLSWYASNKRDLPWRRTTDPFKVLVSEVMLQQTQVSRAIDRFEAFVDRWPTVDDLAAATNEEVLSEWSGLGYNSRALRLRDAAIQLSSSGWPTEPADLRTLPGIGPYTANAIASICFGAQIPAVDTNLRRILSRWAGRPLTGSDLEQFASSVVGAPAGDWNQALMDLGSTLCLAQEPLCDQCPVEDSCADPSVYVRAPRQSRFEGSTRQLRGALVRADLAGVDLIEVGTRLGRSPEEIDRTIGSLAEEGLIRSRKSAR
ncbi:MAG: A/G-specific adenine glycosylase [Armatimonadetes bacterium]|nr:MAG: A/G-specific adenine glycosylase [Armatimonadota bacterium]